MPVSCWRRTARLGWFLLRSSVFIFVAASLHLSLLLRAHGNPAWGSTALVAIFAPAALVSIARVGALFARSMLREAASVAASPTARAGFAGAGAFAAYRGVAEAANFLSGASVGQVAWMAAACVGLVASALLARWIALAMPALCAGTTLAAARLFGRTLLGTWGLTRRCASSAWGAGRRVCCRGRSGSPPAASEEKAQGDARPHAD